MFQNRQGFASLLKDGYKTFMGIDEVTAKNVEACKMLTGITRTSLGPNGLSKLIVTSLGRKYVTNDTSCIVKELEVNHPAARILAMAVEMQKQEMGGGCNFVLVLAGQLLCHADYLLRQGVHLSDVIRGYEMAMDAVPKVLESLTCFKIEDFKDAAQLEKVLRPVVRTKPLVEELCLSSLLAKSICAVMPPKASDFDPENIRISKLQGGRLTQSTVVNGIVVTRPPTGLIEKKLNCKVMVLGCGLEAATTEAKGTVLLHSADELKNFTKGEETQLEDIIKQIKDAGVEAIVVHGGGIADVAQHFCDKYEILTIKISSKFEARRICKALGAQALVRLSVPMAEELGAATSISVLEISSKRVTQILCRDTRVQTVVLRGATPSLLDEAEKAVDDACACAKAFTKDPRFVAGAGAAELEIARYLQKLGSEVPGVEQYAIIKAAEAFESIPRILAESAGLNATEMLATLHLVHGQGRVYEGVNVDAFTSLSISSEGDLGVCNAQSSTIDAFEKNVFDHMLTKLWAIKLASDAALTVLRVDQIIMARPAGGPAPRAPGAPDLD